VAAVRVQSVTNQSLTTSIPLTSTQGWAAPTPGNLLVAWYGGDNTITAPTGYTAGPSVVDNNAAYFYWKIAVAGDSAGLTITQGGATAGTAGLIEYSGVVSASPQETQSGTPTYNATGAQAATIGPLSQVGTGTSGDLFVALGNAHAWASATAPTGPAWTGGFTNFATQASGTTNPQASVSFVADFQNAAAATPSTTLTWTNNAGERSGIIIAFKLAAGGAAPAALPPGPTIIRPT
jgi:hypothetical protein